MDAPRKKNQASACTRIPLCSSTGHRTSPPLQRGIRIQGVGLVSIVPQESRRQGVPHLTQADQSGVPGLRIAHPSQPIAHGIRIGDD